PKGRFSREIITTWEKEMETLGDLQKSLLAVSYIELGTKKSPDELIALLKNNINIQSWLPLSRIYLEQKQIKEAHTLLLAGLQKFTNSPDFRDALNLLLQNSSLNERDYYVSQLLPYYNQSADVDKAAYILWRQAAAYSTGSPIRRNILAKILQNYPTALLAGDASAEFFWEAYTNQNYSQALKLGEAHLANYAVQPESAKVMFWVAKYQEQFGSKEKAKELYKKLIKEHEYSYYAFRSLHRIKALSGGFDEGWNWHKIGKPNVNLDKYFSRSGRWIPPIPSKEYKLLHPTLKELLSLNLWQEAISILPTNYEDNFPLLKSWVLSVVEGKFNQSVAIASQELRNARNQPNPNSLSTFKSNYEIWLLSHPLVYYEYVQNSARRYDFDPLLVQSLMRQESRFQEKIVSSSNAIGLCQLLPSTAREVALTLGLPRATIAKLEIPAYNVELGTKYLSALVDQFDNKKQLGVAAYNAGPGSVSSWRKQNKYKDPDMFVEMIPYSETKNY
ncbi:MAG TPA: transglycosylase SLT domain-containing protein, partial [Vampirovibrionales bacterium]